MSSHPNVRPFPTQVSLLSLTLALLAACGDLPTGAPEPSASVAPSAMALSASATDEPADESDALEEEGQQPAADDSTSAEELPDNEAADAAPMAASAAGRAVTPTLPRIIDLRTPAQTGRTIAVRRGDDLQAAIDAARYGDVITLEPGVTFTGTFRLRAKSGSGWIVIRSAGNGLPAEGRRVQPQHASAMARIVTARSGTAALKTDPGARGYRIVGVEITATSGVRELTSLVNLGDGSSSQNSTARMPNDLVLDRVYVHGHPSLNLRRCVALNSGATSIVDSYLSECHARGADSQAIAGWNGTGPYKIVNNYLEGAGENVMFGGATPAIKGLIPSDIEIRRNHFFKPLEWKGRWTIKNSFELKTGKRILVEGNVFENSWPHAQSGYAWVMKSAATRRAPWTELSDVTLRNNLVRNVAAGVNLAARPEAPAIPANRIRIENNIFDGVGESNGGRSGRQFTLLGDLRDVTITRNTVIPNVRRGNIVVIENRVRASNLVFTDNLLHKVAYGVSGRGKGEGMRSLAFYWTSYTFTGNVIVAASSKNYPAGNSFPATPAAAGFPAVLRQIGSAVTLVGADRPASTAAVAGFAGSTQRSGADVSSLLAAIRNVDMD